jgi:hypothetical protein
MGVKQTFELTARNLKLDDLRTFVMATEHLQGTTNVRIKQSDSQRESFTTLVIEVQT